VRVVITLAMALTIGCNGNRATDGVDHAGALDGWTWQLESGDPMGVGYICQDLPRKLREFRDAKLPETRIRHFDELCQTVPQRYVRGELHAAKAEDRWPGCESIVRALRVVPEPTLDRALVADVLNAGCCEEPKMKYAMRDDCKRLKSLTTRRQP
jgi:hypothetical protein